MTNNERIIELILSAMSAKGISANQLCKQLGINKGHFSRWARQCVDPRNAHGKPATMAGNHIVNMLYHLNILQ